jgi:hypothetical protein
MRSVVGLAQAAHPIPTTFGRVGRNSPRTKWGITSYAKKDSEGQWMPVYIGQGDLSAHSSQQELLDSRGATHVHMHLTTTEEARLAEERDLLARYPNNS